MGFRDIELFNLTLLARQAWRLLQDPDSLSPRVLKARYYPHCNILEASLGNHPSQVWRSIMEGKEILALGIIKRVGTGEDTGIWSENWIPRDYKLWPLCALGADPPQQVSELIDSAMRTWDKQMLVEHFVGPDVSSRSNQRTGC